MSVRVGLVPSDKQVLPQFDKVGTIASRDGSVIEVFRPKYQDVVDSEQQPAKYQKAFLASRCITVDDRRVSVDLVLAHYWDEINKILQIIHKTCNP